MTLRKGSGTATSALERLYVEQYERMVRLAALVVGSDAVAEDCVQDAFVGIQPRLDRVDDAVAYLRTAVMNNCRSHLRRDAVRRALPLQPEQQDPPREPDTTWQVLRTLSPRRRQAIVLRYYEDLPDEKIAEALGCRPATVRSLVHRGLSDLREVLDHG